MRLLLLLSVLGLSGSLISPLPLIAQDMTFFRRSPRLTEAMTTFNQVRVWSAIYYFTITVPPDAGQSLGRITINQRQGFERIELIPEQTVAFLGTRSDRGAIIPLTATWDSREQTMNIILEDPVPAGNTVTIGLRPTANPDFGGIYLYGVTAYPPGSDAKGLYLGAGRLQFYQGGDNYSIY